MLGFDMMGRLALGQFTVANTYLLPSVSIVSSGGLTGVPTSNYKKILTEPNRRIIFAAEISPWTVS